MQETSPLYKGLRQQIGAYYDIQLIQGNNIYDQSELFSVRIYQSLYDSSGPQIGNASATQCDVRLKASSSEWPRMAQFIVRVRLSSANGQTKSEWLTLGTFYTDERTEDKFGNLSIIGYDSMLMTEQYWTDKISASALPANWPITSKAWVDLIVGAGLIEVDSSTTLNNTVRLIGLNTASTIRDNLKTIAAAHGGNWTVTPAGKLKLVYPQNAGDNVIDLGMAVQGFDSSPELEGITGVNLETEDGTVATAGTTAGYVLNGECEFASSTGVAELCLQNVQGYRYKPFTAEKALLDPAAEIGDLVTIDEITYQMMTIDWNISTWPTANISAPYDEEVDHEYKILSPEAKTYRKGIAATDEKLKLYPTTMDMNTAISQSASSIRIEASQTYVTIDDYDVTIADLQAQIDGAISTYSGPDIPTLNNYPAEDWTTPAQRSEHVGCLYLVTAAGGSPMAGQYYRFERSGSSYGWVLVEDTALATALARAAEAQEAADQAIADAATAQAAADAAQGTADQARAEAVAEAAQAQAVAIAQAAVDATNKANQALADARDYATQQIEHFVYGEYAEDMAEVRGQVDQKIQTYYQGTDPSTDWGDGTDHTGDLWYNTNSQLYYRWNGTSWEELTSNPPRAVFDVIDGKAQIFVNEPVPPYYEGDLWAQGATGDILRCTTARESGSYVETDWTLASKYTDDSSLNLFINGAYAEMIDSIRAQIDQKAETYYQADDPSQTDGKTKWNSLAGYAVVGISIVGSTNEAHTGDMWYRTTDDTTWYWNGSGWVQQTIPRDVFDVIDGKAQIFVSQPTTPYAVGDLWFNSATSDIMTCIRSRATGSYTASDWQKRNKYTDDAKANAVETDLHGNYFTKVETSAAITTQADQIRASVVSKTGGTSQSFSWTLTDSAHVWYSNNQEVLRIDNSGLHVRGDGTFSGTVSAATITGSTITGGSINIGNGNFRVDSSGNVYASNGTFAGNVYASNIQYGSTGGYFNGAGITGSSLTTGQFSSGVNTSLGYANQSHDVFEGISDAKYVKCTVYMQAPVLYAKKNGQSGNTYYNIENHTHDFSVSGGTVTIEKADYAGNPHSFNIADTQFYKDGVSAATANVSLSSVSALGYSATSDKAATLADNQAQYTSGKMYGRIQAKLSNDKTYSILVGIDATKAYNSGVSAVQISTVSGTTYSTTADHSSNITDANARYMSGMLYGRLTASLSNGNSETIYVGIDATKAYNSGINSVTVNQPTSQGRNSYYWGSDDLLYCSIGVRAAASNGNYNTATLTFGVTDIYNYGRNSVSQRSVTNITTYGTINYYDNSGSPYYTVTVRARLSDNTYSDTYSFNVNATSAYNSGYNAGYNAAYNSGYDSGYSAGRNDGFAKGGYRLVYLGSSFGSGAYVSGYYYPYADSSYMSRYEGSSVWNADYPVLYFN